MGKNYAIASQKIPQAFLNLSHSLTGGKLGPHLEKTPAATTYLRLVFLPFLININRNIFFYFKLFSSFKV